MTPNLDAALCLLTQLVLPRVIEKKTEKQKCLLGKFLGDPALGVPLNAEKRVKRMGYVLEQVWGGGRWDTQPQKGG